MIGSLRGVVIERLGHALLVEVGGVGYRVSTTSSTIAAVGRPGEPVFLHVHTHVREDALVLYGFLTLDERWCFEALLAAHGVGPALALSILSALHPVALREAVATDDVGALTIVPGVGKKTAARLLIDLKSRLGGEIPEGIPGSDAPTSAKSEVRVALASLGYGPDEVRMAVRDLPAEGSVEDLLRAALRELAGARVGA